LENRIKQIEQRNIGYTKTKEASRTKLEKR